MIDHEAGHFEQPYLARQADVTQRCDPVIFTGAHSHLTHQGATPSVSKCVPSTMR